MVRGWSATKRRSRNRPSRWNPSRCARRGERGGGGEVIRFDLGLDAVGVERVKAVGENGANRFLHETPALKAGDQYPTEREPAIPWLARVIVDHADELIVGELAIGPGQYGPGGMPVRLDGK